LLVEESEVGMKRILFPCVVWIGVFAFGADAPTARTVIEISQPMAGRGEGLGTAGYAATEQERPFQKKVTEQPIDHWAGLDVPPPEGEKPDPKQVAEEKKRKAEELARAKRYSLNDQAGEYVGWFGIVRGSSWNESQGRSELLLQHCYSDGLTDLHIQIVSIFGAGDFRALVADKAKNIPLLSLVCVYGKVSAGKDGVPDVTAEFVRVWDWGLFTFMDYGIDKTNPKWRAMRKVRGEDIYTPRPSEKYYQAVLGKREPSPKDEAPAK
jgi:hypothetical protein